jgi:hypothetical protein
MGDTTEQQVYVSSDMWVRQTVARENFFFNFVVFVILLISHTANCGLAESSEPNMWKNDGAAQTQYYIVYKQYTYRHFVTNPQTMKDTNTVNCAETGFKDMGMIRVN